MFVKRHRIDATVTVSGGASQVWYTNRLQGGGYLEYITYRNGNSNSASGIATGAHLTITAADSSSVLLSTTATGTTGETVTYFPRGKAQSVSAELFSPASGAGAVVGWPVHIAIGAEPIKVQITSAGAASLKKFFALDFYLRGGD